MRYWIVRNVAAVETDGLAIEEIGEGFVGSGGITQRTRGKRDAAYKVFVQLAVHSETHADAAPVPVSHAVLEEALTAYPDVAIEAEARLGER